ncbi:hypothetical protein SprV_0200785300 [Sparganum proliferum]
MQQSMDHLAAGYAKFGLTIDTDKTLALSQRLWEAEHNTFRITVNDSRLQTADKFACARSTLLRNADIDDEVPNRRLKARQAFGWLQGHELNAKPKMYKAVVPKTLLCGKATRAAYANYARKPNQSYLSFNLTIQRLRRQDRVQDTEGPEQTEILSSYAMLNQLQLRWLGHLARMDDASLSKQLSCGDVITGTRREGEPKATLQGHFKELSEVIALQPRELERHQPEQTGMKRRRVDGRSHVQGKAGSRRQSRKEPRWCHDSLMSTASRFQHARAANAYSARESAS